MHYIKHTFTFQEIHVDDTLNQDTEYYDDDVATGGSSKTDTAHSGKAHVLMNTVPGSTPCYPA